MITKALLETIYEAANMQRWNDKIRPVELRELDKQAHKMIIAYVICKFEEHTQDFSFIKVIEGGLFEFLQRLIVTDLKPQIVREIRKDKAGYMRLNKWVYEQLKPTISPLGPAFCTRFHDYILNTTETLDKRILRAAHFYATKWEFDILERANPNGYEMYEIKRRIQAELEKLYDLDGMKKLTMYADLRNFIDLCGQLRFQVRWSHIHMVPRISVLGHMLIVAILAYLLSLEIGACEKRCINNYLTGLFHDLPEVLTRDIISPLKETIRGLGRMIKRYERRQMREEVYKLIPKGWHPEIRMFTQNEFQSIITQHETIIRTPSSEISRLYNRNEFNPRDGELIYAIDQLAAYMEAFLCTEKNQIRSPQLEDAKTKLASKYQGQRGSVAGIDFASIYAQLR